MGSESEQVQKVWFVFVGGNFYPQVYISKILLVVLCGFWIYQNEAEQEHDNFKSQYRWCVST